MATGKTPSSYTGTAIVESLRSGVAVLGPVAFHPKSTGVCSQKLKHRCSFFYASQSYLVRTSKKRVLTVRNSSDGSGLGPSLDNTNGSPRLIRTIQDIQTKIGARIRETRKNFPTKLLFFFVGFYCATAFATVIGQTGDWDILSAALAVVIVEGIGALMYRASLPVLSKIRSLITMFNYWKAGLSLGLFLDSFKYEMDDIFGSSSVPNFNVDSFSFLF